MILKIFMFFAYGVVFSMIFTIFVPTQSLTATSREGADGNILQATAQGHAAQTAEESGRNGGEK